MSDPLGDVDGVILLSFGGPDGPDEVLPFLRRVTAGRGVPDERLQVVGRHYWEYFDGRSPINEQNRALRAALEDAFTARGWRCPIHLANRNSAPFLDDLLGELGPGRFLALTTSAYPGYSSCRQYLEDLDAAAADQEVLKVSPYGHHPGFATAVTEATAKAIATLPERQDRLPRLLFVTHSIPFRMQETAGPGGESYLRWHQILIAEVLRRLDDARLHADLVFCSRSGAPGVPWLEPDINDHLHHLAEQGVREVVVVPIGFVSDHMEVAYDLDIEAAQTAANLGMGYQRAATVHLHPAFIDALCEVVAARATGNAHQIISGGEQWLSCPAKCCPAPARHRQQTASAGGQPSPPTNLAPVR